METKEIAKTIQRLLSITETGLAFSRDEFDRERYLELRQLLGHLLADWSRVKMRKLGLYQADFVKSAYLLRKISSRKSKKKRDLMFQSLVCLQFLIPINFNFRVSNMLNWSSSVR